MSELAIIYLVIIFVLLLFSGFFSGRIYLVTHFQRI